MRNVTIIGAGRTGRGMFGEMFFSESSFHLTFADCDSDLITGLRAQGYYTATRIDLLNGVTETTRIEGFDVVSTVLERDRYLSALVFSELVAVAVFPSSFDHVAADLADMIAARCTAGISEPVAIILGGNYVGLKKRFDMAILNRLSSEQQREHFRNTVSLITSKANRKVVHVKADGSDSFALIGDNKQKLLVEDAFPFEKNYSYPSFFELSDSVETSMVKKIWSENLVHCSLGFMAAHEGIETLNQAVENDRIRTLAFYAWNEGRSALQMEYEMPLPTSEETITMFKKFSSSFFHDRIARIVRQPIRKLGRRDRFIGPALLCVSHGMLPYFILHAAAYGFCNNTGTDRENLELMRMISECGIERTVESVCGLDRLHPEEQQVADLLCSAIREISYPDRNRLRLRTIRRTGDSKPVA